MARFSGKKARRLARKADDVAAPASDQAARFALMKEREEEINRALAAHLATGPTAAFDVVVAHRGDMIGVEFHEALARQTGRQVPGDVGVFCVDRGQILALLDVANPDMAEALGATTSVNVVCFAFQGTTIYTPPAAPVASTPGEANLWPAPLPAAPPLARRRRPRGSPPPSPGPPVSKPQPRGRTPPPASSPC